MLLSVFMFSHHNMIDIFVKCYTFFLYNTTKNLRKSTIGHSFISLDIILNSFFIFPIKYA